MATGVPNLPQDALSAQRFSIELDSVALAQFQEIGGTTSEIDIIEVKEVDKNGKLTLKKQIGAVKPPTITLKRAANQSMDLWNWHKAALEGRLKDARRNGSIVQYDFEHKEVSRYNFTNAWVSKVTVSGFKAGDNSPSIEEVTITCETFERVK